MRGRPRTRGRIVQNEKGCSDLQANVELQFDLWTADKAANAISWKLERQRIQSDTIKISRHGLFRAIIFFMKMK